MNVPPCDPMDDGRSAATIEQEKLILGAVLLLGEVPAECDGLQPSHFYLPESGALYTAMQRVARRGDPVSYAQVKFDLEKHGRSDLNVMLYDLNREWQLRRDVEPCVSQVLDAYRRRQLEQYAKKILSLARTPTSTSADVLDAAERELSAFAAMDDGREGPQTIGAILEQGWSELESRIDERRPRRGMPTGLRDLDADTSGGWKPGQLIVIGARPSMGKTSLALQSAIAAAREGMSVLFCSLETSKESIRDRMLASEARVDLKALGEGRVTQAELQRISAARLRLESLPIAIDDRGTLTVAAIRSMARRHKAKHGLGAVFIDYLQLVSPDRQGGSESNREREVASVSRGLKLLAKDLAVPVVALCQLNRKADEREDGPVLSDLRESGAIEQDADVVVFLHREDGVQNGTATLKIAKQKDGPTGFVTVAWHPTFVKFGDLASGYAERAS